MLILLYATQLSVFCLTSAETVLNRNPPTLTLAGAFLLAQMTLALEL